MKLYRLIGVALAAAIMFTGRPLVGRSEQGAAALRLPASHSIRCTSGQLVPHRCRDASPTSRSTKPIPLPYYVATAHGGVWKTSNNGTTFEAIFQDQGPLSIGDVTISQSNPIFLVGGSGESSNRQRVVGDGVYKSTDGGKTFTHMGLRAAKAINRIVIDPRDNNIVFVAVTEACGDPEASAASTRPSTAERRGNRR